MYSGFLPFFITLMMPAQTLSLPLLVDAEQLLPVLSHPLLRIVDLGKPRVYEQVHLPHALSLPPALLVRQEEHASGLLPNIEQLQQLVQTLQITPQHQVVVYDDEGGAWAGRLIWTLHILGFSRVSLLNGGIHAWLAKGLPTSSEMTSLALVQPFQLNGLNPEPRITLAELKTILDEQPDAYNLWDCRTQGEYTGARLAARRGGHLPGAFHYEWNTVLDRQNNLCLRPLPEIMAELQQQGLDPQKPVIVYCQSHHRSGLAYVLARLFNWPVRAYDGAWSEWGNRLDTPIVTGEHPL